MIKCIKLRPLSLVLLFLISLISNDLKSQDKPAYRIFNAKGKKVKYKKMLRASTEAEIMLFGESHNNPIAHWLQFELTRDLGNVRSLILAAEMIEADNQDELDAYLNGDIDKYAFDSTARLWPNYKTDYAPLVNYARDNSLAFVASNIPRRYASQVYHNGFECLDSLSEEEKSWMAPLPIKFDPELPQYKKILNMMGDHGSPRLVMAQAIKDATMAHRILKFYEDGKLLIHYNGSYHSDFYEGILWYLKGERPELIYTTISTVSQASNKKLEKEHLGRADFIICVDENMTTTY